MRDRGKDDIHYAMLYWLIGLGIVAVLVGSTVSSAFRWMARLIVSIALAIMIAVPSGVLLMEQNEDEVAMALLLVVPFAVAIYWLMRPRPLADPEAWRVPRARAETPPLKRATFRRVFSADQIAQVWDRLEDEAPHQAARIAVARRSTEQSRQALKARHLELAAHSALVMLEKRIPELIDDELNMAGGLPGPAGVRAIDELVDLLERFAADCERQLGRDRRMGASETRLLRQHIERYLGHDGHSLNP